MNPATSSGLNSHSCIGTEPDPVKGQTTPTGAVGQSRHGHIERLLDEGLDYFQAEGAKARRARHSDPETSHAAAKNADKFARSHAGRIVTALRINGPRTAHELSHLIGLSVVQIDRRTIELQRAGLIDVVYHPHGGLRVIDGFRLWRAV